LIQVNRPRTNLDGTTRNDVGLSPVSVISHCEQARPRNTPRTGGQNRDVHLRDDSLRNRPVLQPKWEPGTPHEAECDPSRSVLAWPLRHRPLLDDAGCIDLQGAVSLETSSKDFWTGTAPPR
jgi:hypothetical protein